MFSGIGLSKLLARECKGGLFLKAYFGMRDKRANWGVERI